MAERRDISDALREAVDRTVAQAVETSGRAQGAVDDIAGTVDGLRRGAEQGLRSGRRNVRAAVEERLPATNDDLRELEHELRSLGDRLAVIERRLEISPAAGASRTRSRPTAAKATPPKAKSSEKVKSGRAPTSGGSRSAAKAKPPARSSAAKAGSARRAKPGSGTKRGR